MIVIFNEEEVIITYDGLQIVIQEDKAKELAHRTLDYFEEEQLMNKEEIEKAIKALICSQCGKCYFPKRRNCRACLEKNRRMIKKYIQQLENKASILDKVTDKLKKENEKDRKTVQYYEKAYRTAKKNNNKFYMKSHKRKIDMSNARREVRKEILNIIEERQYCCNCGVELNSENKALDNMCNECKYRIRLLKGRKEIMEDKIKKCIDKIECITRYMSTILVLILATLGKTRENNTFYAVGFTIVVCEIIEMTILAYLYGKISDVFFEEKIKELEGKKKIYKRKKVKK